MAIEAGSLAALTGFTIPVQLLGELRSRKIIDALILNEGLRHYQELRRALVNYKGECISSTKLPKIEDLSSTMRALKGSVYVPEYEVDEIPYEPLRYLLWAERCLEIDVFDFAQEDGIMPGVLSVRIGFERERDESGLVRPHLIGTLHDSGATDFGDSVPQSRQQALDMSHAAHQLTAFATRILVQDRLRTPLGI